MKFIDHDKRPKIEEVYLEYNPMSVWLTSKEQLIIEKGDRLVTVARKIHEVHPEWKLRKKTLMKLVAYWFALGERLRDNRMDQEKWSKRELRAAKNRRYLGRRSSLD